MVSAYLVAAETAVGEVMLEAILMHIMNSRPDRPICTGLYLQNPKRIVLPGIMTLACNFNT